ncbi:MAG: hypothetical protein IKH04_10725 [Kiritimatiellae bacterium]|nr:hypothetical protein [Kiritimatiellia bacterium]
MNPATAIKVGKTAIKVAKKMKELYDIDQRKRVVFNKDFFSGTFREKVMINGQERVVPDFRNDDFQIIDRRVTIFATGDRDPFCDASSFSPEKILTIDLMRASATHDAIYQYQEDIAKAWGWPVEDVRELADHAHGNELQHEARKQSSAPMRILGEVVAHVAHFCTRTFGGIYHRTHAGRNAVVAALVLCAAGCAEIPQVFDPSDERPDYEIHFTASGPSAAGAAGGGRDRAGASIGGALAEQDSGRATEISAPAKTTADAVEFSLLQWAWGGFDGAGARPVDGCRIGGLSVGSHGMGCAWEAGGCEMLGASSRSDAACLACLFVRGADGAWRGGKFDWISTSRTTRDFKNIGAGYGGWPKDAVGTAREFAFVIVSEDGRRRSNVITCGR